MAHDVAKIPFADLYPLYLNKVQRKGRTEQELERVLTWLTGYDDAGLASARQDGRDLTEFFRQAPGLNPHVDLITGVVCGVRVEDIEDPLMQRIRWMDKLVDELARGKKIENILRRPKA